MRVLVVGAAGLLGAAIVREFSTDSTVIALDRASLDVTDQDAVSRTLTAQRPDVVVNCAAYNAVDEAETNAALALRVNAFAVLTLARAAAVAGTRFVHYSSDFVFDGRNETPYTEADAPQPQSVYGASKLLGEMFALDSPRSYVLRVESLFGHPGGAGGRQGSLGTIVARIRSGSPVPVFVDRTVSPSFTTDVAAATRQLVALDAPAGLYHCVNSGHARWAAVAEEAARIIGVPMTIEPLTLESAALKAPRPRFCALSNARLASAGVAMRTWQDALRAYLTESPV